MRFENLDDPNPIRRARHKAGLTLQQLGDQACIHASKLSQLENGLRPRRDELARLAGVLGCSVDELRAREAATR